MLITGMCMLIRCRELDMITYRCFSRQLELRLSSSKASFSSMLVRGSFHISQLYTHAYIVHYFHFTNCKHCNAHDLLQPHYLAPDLPPHLPPSNSDSHSDGSDEQLVLLAKVAGGAVVVAIVVVVAILWQRRRSKADFYAGLSNRFVIDDMSDSDSDDGAEVRGSATIAVPGDAPDFAGMDEMELNVLSGLKEALSQASGSALQQTNEDFEIVDKND